MVTVDTWLMLMLILRLMHCFPHAEDRRICRSFASAIMAQTRLDQFFGSANKQKAKADLDLNPVDELPRPGQLCAIIVHRFHAIPTWLISCLRACVNYVQKRRWSIMCSKKIMSANSEREQVISIHFDTSRTWSIMCSSIN